MKMAPTSASQRQSGAKSAASLTPLLLLLLSLTRTTLAKSFTTRSSGCWHSGVSGRYCGFVGAGLSHRRHGNGAGLLRVSQRLSSSSANSLDNAAADDSIVVVSDRKRRSFLATASAAAATTFFGPGAAVADPESATATLPPVEVVASGDVKKLFNEGRALEGQGNILAAQRLYTKVTKIAPRFVYGWSNLGNTLVAQGELNTADASYSTAISLCEEVEYTPGVRHCKDLYLIHLNRGSVRLNNGMAKEALADLERSDALRARPDSVVLQNRARARELNGFYFGADKDYDVAISMTSNEVSPFWLRSAMVKFQLGDLSGAMDLADRVENRFPEAPEVRAAYAVMLSARGKGDASRQKFLEIPDRARKNYTDEDYLKNVVSWPPVMKEKLAELTRAVGDR